MAKDKKKHNSNYNTFSEKNALKMFNKATCLVIKEELKFVDVDDLINQIYLTTNNKNAEYMLKEFEKQLILSKLNEDKFNKGLFVFFTEMEKYIRKGKLYNDFFELAYTVYISMCKKNVNVHVLNGFFDLLVQQHSFFGGGSKTVVYGTTHTNNRGLLITDEIKRNLTEINFELHLLSINPFSYSEQSMFKIFHKYGYKEVNSMETMHNLITQDQVITNMCYMLSYFINDNTKWLFAKPFRSAIATYNTHQLFNHIENNDALRERLKLRQNLLPNDGIKAHLYNYGDITEITMQEIIKNETVILLYKIKFKDETYTSGFFDTHNSVWYDMWKESNQTERCSLPLEKIVLQLYMMLTCRLKEEEKDLIDFVEIKNKEIIPYFNPMVKFEIKKKHITDGDGVSREFNKDNYNQELRNVDAYTRKLPVGSSASEEAIEFAKRLGIELPKNRTFVRDFHKKVYVKENE